MKVWIIVRSILFGIAKLAGAVVMLGFSLGVIVGRKLKEDSTISLADEVSATQDMAEDMTKDMTNAIENAAEQVIKDLEERTEVAVRLLDEAEEKIAGLKDMLRVYDEYVFDEPMAEETVLEGTALDGTSIEETATEEESLEDRAQEAELQSNLVFKFADEGLSLQEIAKKAGIGCGEVELILNLRGNND